jgi:hypothetical protein
MWPPGLPWMPPGDRFIHGGSPGGGGPSIAGVSDGCNQSSIGGASCAYIGALGLPVPTGPWVVASVLDGTIICLAVSNEIPTIITE